jgi:ketosteroid isomerase-like protein
MASTSSDRAIEVKALLAAAIGREDYGTAATLRDELATLQLDDEVAVLQANEAFYEAFSARNLEAMEAMWVSEGDGAVCAHPGFPPLRGHRAIIDSWQQIFSDSNMQLKAENVRCLLLSGGLSAVVTCVERIEGAGDNALTATNIFEKGTDGRWRMVLHQAGPLVRRSS